MKESKRQHLFSRIYIYVVTLSIAISFLLFVYLVFFYDFYPIFEIADSERVGLAQLSFEITSMAAIIIAIYEFRKAQKRPSLDLWSSYCLPIDPGCRPEKSLVKNIENSNTAVFRFHFALENSGELIARWVKLDVICRRPEPHSNVQIRFRLEDENHNRFWNANFQEERRQFRFDGKESFVIYPRTRAGSIEFGELENLGIFHLAISSNDNLSLSPGEYYVDYIIRADQIEEVRGVLTFQLTDQ